MSTLEVVWYARNVGQIILILVMSNAVRNSDWEQVAKEATECAEVDSKSNTSPGWLTVKSRITQARAARVIPRIIQFHTIQFRPT